MFPSEPPVAKFLVPERRGAGKGAPAFGAAKRTLVQRAPLWPSDDFDGRRSGNTFPLVGSELFLPLFAPCHTQPPRTTSPSSAASLSRFQQMDRMLPFGIDK